MENEMWSKPNRLEQEKKSIINSRYVQVSVVSYAAGEGDKVYGSKIHN